MTESDLRRIESALDVILPADYRRISLHFPIRYEAGTTNEILWDDADALIERNRDLRGAKRAMPDRYLFIGDDGAGWQHLIEWRANPPTIYLMEYDDVGSIRPELSDAGEPLLLRQWFHSQLEDMRDAGIDISADKPSPVGGWGCVLGTITFCVVVAIAISLMVAGVQSIFGI